MNKKIVRNSYLLIVLSFVIIFSFLFFFITFNLKSYFISEKEIGRFESPNGTYTIIAYETDGGATTSLGLICKLHRNKGFSFDRKIFTEYPRFFDLKIIWEDDDTVIINGERIENVLIDKATIYHTKPTPSESTEG